MLTTVGRSTCHTFMNGRGLCFSSLHDIQINPLCGHCSMFRPNSELLGLIQICIVTFRWFIKSCEHLMIISYHRLSEQPPVYSKPKDSQAPSQAASYPAQGAAYYPQHQQGQVGLTSWASKCSKCFSSDSDAIRWSGLHSPVHWDHTGLLWPIHPGIALQQQQNKSHLPFILGRAPPPFLVATPLPTNKPKVVTNKKELQILPRKKITISSSEISSISQEPSRQPASLAAQVEEKVFVHLFLFSSND